MKNKSEIKDYVSRKTEEKYRTLSDMLMKWKMFPANNKLKIKKYNGEYVSYSGIKFEGSPKIVFRSFFDPYIEAFCLEIIRGIIEYLKERNISFRSARKLTKEGLKQLADRFYSEMHMVDNGVNVKQKKAIINEFIDEQVNSYFHEKFWNKERVWKTVLVLLSIGGISVAVKLGIQVIVINYFNK